MIVFKIKINGYLKLRFWLVIEILIIDFYYELCKDLLRLKI